MKNSGIEWIGEIPSEWRIGKVKQIFYRSKEINETLNPTVLSLARSGIKERDISNNEGQLAASYDNYNRVRKGDLLLNPMDLISGANCNYSYIEGVISPAYINLRKKRKASSKYYDYYFKLQYWSFAFFAHGKGVSYEHRWTLNNDTLMNYPIPIPSPEEQQKIANYLDEKVSQIDSIIEKTKQSIEELKKYRRTLITETVTRGINPNIEMKDSGIEGLEMVPKHWNIVKLRYLIQFQPPKSEVKEKNIECTFLPMEKLKNGKMVLDENRIIDEVYTGYTYFKENDIVLAKVTPCFENGNIAIAKNLTNSIGFGTTEIYTLRAQKISKEFLFYALQDERFKNEGISSMYGTGGLKRVPGNFILNYKVVVPSNTEQQQIVDFLNEKTEYIENLIIKKEELLNEMESYKKSLIYEYVTGKKEVM